MKCLDEGLAFIWSPSLFIILESMNGILCVCNSEDLCKLCVDVCILGGGVGP